MESESKVSIIQSSNSHKFQVQYDIYPLKHLTDIPERYWLTAPQIVEYIQTVNHTII